VLEGKPDTNTHKINQLRLLLSKNSNKVNINDFGTGQTRSVQVSSLENRVAVRPKYGELLYRLVNYLKPNAIIEIGTSIGLSTSYMAIGGNTRITTLEGAPEIAALAKQNLAALNFNNVEMLVGEFATTLPLALSQTGMGCMVFFDGNHTKQATLQYFELCLAKANENSIFIFDDIYWSKEMTEAWQHIIQHPQITLSIDVYQFGICFFRKDKLAKEHFVLRY
jgi:predicted O-methyltransferase YrrM